MLFSSMKSLLLVLSPIFVIISIQLVGVSPAFVAIEDTAQAQPAHQSPLPIETPAPSVFVFFCPPASFAHNQITVALELCKRGHRVVFATLTGFRRYLDDHLKFFLMENPNFDANLIDVLEFSPDTQSQFSTSQFDSHIGKITQTRPDDRQFDEHKMAMQMYDGMFLSIKDGIEQLRLSDFTPRNFEDKRKQELIFSASSLVVLPGPWSVPLRYCHQHNLKFVFMLASPCLEIIVSNPFHSPLDGEAEEKIVKRLIKKVRRWGKAFSRQDDSFDAKLIQESPTLRLVQSIPALMPLSSYSPLTVFTGPSVSMERRDQRRLSKPVLLLLNNEQHLPVIYLSLGTYAKIGQQQIEKLSEAFFPFDKRWGLIWALSSDQQKWISNSTQLLIEKYRHLVIVANWVETPAVLDHPNVALFVSHCGANGLNEALVTGTPILGLPLFGDQPKNCAAAEENLRTARCLSIYETPTSELRQLAVDIVLHENHPVHEAASRAKVLTTKGFRPVDSSADWLEVASVLRGDFKFLDSPLDRESIFQIYSLEIALIVAASVSYICWCLGVRRGEKIHRAEQPSTTKRKEA